MEIVPANADNYSDEDYEMPAAYLRFVDSRVSDQPMEDLPI